VLPLHHDPASLEGRAALGLEGMPELAETRVVRFRMKPGEDASCLNLYRPERPTVIAPGTGFLAEGRFAFQSSLAETAEEKANPWLLLERDAHDGAIPVIADAGALAYVLHRRLGESWTLGDSGVRVRVVAALRPGLLQSELVTGERHFQAAFPEAEGFRFFLIETEPGREAGVAAALESRLADFGFDAETTASRLAAFHRVENTYIATFQTLGGLGLLLGTLGIGAVLVRNAFEQRRELASCASATAPRHRTMVLAETASCSSRPRSAPARARGGAAGARLARDAAVARPGPTLLVVGAVGSSFRGSPPRCCGCRCLAPLGVVSSSHSGLITRRRVWLAVLACVHLCRGQRSAPDLRLPQAPATGTPGHGSHTESQLARDAHPGWKVAVGTGHARRSSLAIASTSSRERVRARSCARSILPAVESCGSSSIPSPTR
jgi:hypothetical protein